MTFDPNQVKIDLYNFKLCKHLYTIKIALKDEYISMGYKVNEHVDRSKEEVPIETQGTRSFKDAVEYVKKSGLCVMEATDSAYGYSPDVDVSNINIIEEVADIFKKYLFLKEAIQ